METFQAKSIQKILGIPKYRYDYILMKIRIEPDIEKVRGTGRTNLFSFSKLLEFAIASTAIDIGMSPDIIRYSLESIRQDDKYSGWKLFIPDVEIKPLSYHVVSNFGSLHYCYSGNVHKQATYPTIFKAPDGIDFKQIRVPDLNIKMLTEVMKFGQELINKGTEKAFGYLTLNLSEIKKHIETRKTIVF